MPQRASTGQRGSFSDGGCLAPGHRATVKETQIENHGNEYKHKLNGSHRLMRVLQVCVNNQCEWQKDEAKNGNDDPVDVAKESGEEPQEDDCNSWKSYRQQRK
jgi:hypothetical protein